MRLTLLNQFYAPDISPTAHLCASLAEHRAQLGDRVVMLTSRAGYLSAPINDGKGGTVRVRRLWSTRLGSRTPLRRFFDWATFYIPAFWAAFTMPRQDVFIALTTPPFIALAGWLHKRRHPRCRFILWNMDTYPEAAERTKMIKPGGVAAHFLRRVNRLIFNRMDHLVCLDGAMAELLLSQYSRPGHDVPHTIIPNWERASLFPMELPSSTVGEPVLPSLQGRFVVLYLGNAGYGHEFQTLLDAAERLRDAPVVFLIVGGGSLIPNIDAARRQRGLTNVVFRDYVPKQQTPALMKLADCALITLENEMVGVMSPSKLHANLAMRLPVIYVGPRHSNVDEAIERFGCGISLSPGDAGGLADFVHQLMANAKLHDELKRRARQAFDEAYCDLQALPRFDQVIGQVTSHARGLKNS